MLDLQQLGQIVGSSTAATLIGAHLGYGAVSLRCTGATPVGLAVDGAMYLRLRRAIPTLADAS